MMCPFDEMSGYTLVLLILAIVPSALAGFLLCISPLMIWLNLRRLRKDLHADLQALRASVERAGVPAAAPEVPPTVVEAPEAAKEQEPATGQIGFSCPECGKFFEGPDALAGSDYTCPECKVSFHIH